MHWQSVMAAGIEHLNLGRKTPQVPVVVRSKKRQADSFGSESLARKLADRQGPKPPGEDTQRADPYPRATLDIEGPNHGGKALFSGNPSFSKPFDGHS